MVSDEKTQELLIRLDERSKAIKNDVVELKDSIAMFKISVHREMENFVTKDQFLPISRGVYTVVTSIIVGIIGSLLYFLGIRPH